MLIHTGEKLYQCSECNQGFNKKVCHKEHMMMPTGKKPYQCRYCGKDFSMKSNFTEHHSTNTGDHGTQNQQIVSLFLAAHGSMVAQRVTHVP